MVMPVAPNEAEETNVELTVTIFAVVVVMFVLLRVPEEMMVAPNEAVDTRELTNVPVLRVPVMRAPPETSKVVPGEVVLSPTLPFVVKRLPMVLLLKVEMIPLEIYSLPGKNGG